jgi:hypothetical protein
MMAAGRGKSYLGVLALAVLGVGCGRPSEPDKPVFESGVLSSAQVCGDCHTDIYAFWLTSRHAAAAAGEAFLTAVRESSDERLVATCLGCHAPASKVTGSLDPEHPLNREGVTCDLCHSMIETRLDRPDNPLVLDVGPVKYGPIRDASSEGHQVAYSAFHAEALFCAGCHEFEGPAGLGVLSTYSEWVEYRDGGGTQTCQDCHMPRVAGNLVDPKLKRSETALINAHQMPGGSFQEQLAQAVRLEIEDPLAEGSGVKARVRVTNLGAGHRVPTGLPNRQVVLTLRMRARDGRAWSGERVYERTVTDGDGRPIFEDARIFLEARSVGVDTRLAPWESRVEDFAIPWAGPFDFELTASLGYRKAGQTENSAGGEYQSVTREFTLRDRP